MDVEFEAGPPDALRRRVTILTGIPALLATLVGTLGPFVVDVPGLTNLIFVGGVWLLGSWLVGHRDSYRLSEAGVRRSGRVWTRTYDWDDFEGYEASDETMILHRAGWRPAVRFSLTDVDEPDHVREVVADHLSAA
ncbi:hypothetical protein SAMN05216388_100197 [Halorientalis persicus]|jgi:hypothetical protein|uniref:PH domain-containing protein n=1 Tax=Halorientalis persicus TaxID=1367881 RepID=A0A1H8CVU1_9EURY|nr:hypothetical protein [Halorientalis persicus]SEM99233.1 hypothetical protein SAMN05216388_100197 [Halorientalis persicus]